MGPCPLSGHCADVPQCPLLTQNGHRLIGPALLDTMKEAPNSSTDQGGGKRRGRARPRYFEETGTDTLVTQALVGRRFGVAGIVTINPLLPHLHEGAGS